jgi:hypothetical protein
MLRTLVLKKPAATKVRFVNMLAWNAEVELF